MSYKVLILPLITFYRKKAKNNHSGQSCIKAGQLCPLRANKKKIAKIYNYTHLVERHNI